LVGWGGWGGEGVGVGGGVGGGGGGEGGWCGGGGGGGGSFGHIPLWFAKRNGPCALARIIALRISCMGHYLDKAPPPVRLSDARTKRKILTRLELSRSLGTHLRSVYTVCTGFSRWI